MQREDRMVLLIKSGDKCTLATLIIAVPEQYPIKRVRQFLAGQAWTRMLFDELRKQGNSAIIDASPGLTELAAQFTPITGEPTKMPSMVYPVQLELSGMAKGNVTITWGFSARHLKEIVEVREGREGVVFYRLTVELFWANPGREGILAIQFVAEEDGSMVGQGRLVENALVHAALSFMGIPLRRY
ncbi:hypothetical protein GGF32_001870 [Allomyces javanicus]|nr:hypothetical protein GGF32_001870 [Allomyces javanicus]